MNLELSEGQVNLLYNTLAVICLQYEDAIEKADTAPKKQLYRNYRNQTMEIMRQIEKQKNKALQA